MISFEKQGAFIASETEKQNNKEKKRTLGKGWTQGLRKWLKIYNIAN